MYRYVKYNNYIYETLNTIKYIYINNKIISSKYIKNNKIVDIYCIILRTIVIYS